MMGLLLAIACTPEPDDATTSGPGGQVVIDVGDAVQVRGGDGEWDWGTALTAGCDLDHDGRLEWAVGAPRFGEDLSPFAVVRVFEGQEPIAERHPAVDRPKEHGNYLAAGEDLDGDGFPDLAFTTVSYQVPSRSTVAFTTDEEDDWVLDQDGEMASVSLRGVTMPRTGSGPALLVTSIVRRDLVRGPLVRGAHPKASDDTLMDAYEPPIPIMGLSARIDPDGDGVDAFLAGANATNGTLDHPLVGAYVCPVATALDVPDDCQRMGEEGQYDIGFYQAAGDLDGDGIPEVVSADIAANGTDGHTYVYRADGTELAHIVGTKGAMFGRFPTIVHDDSGRGWLMISQTNYSGNERGTVWAFRGDRVEGEMVDTDADLVYTGRGIWLGAAITTYRETPADPLILLLGSPTENTVYMLPFDP